MPFTIHRFVAAGTQPARLLRDRAPEHSVSPGPAIVFGGTTLPKEVLDQADSVPAIR
jgi:hypothetical protein